MEHNLGVSEDHSSSSVDETDGRSGSEIGIGRSYECVFCKRGFTTAQALGGHMNIHRKDRVKSKTNSTSSNSSSSMAANSNSSKLCKYSDFNSGSLRPNYQSYPSHQLSMSTMAAAAAASSELHINYQTYLPSSTWSLGSTTSQEKYHDDLYVHNNPELLNSFKGNLWHKTQLGSSHSSDHHHHIQEKRSTGNGEEDELDLELRLGHDHR